jgi:Flp pilus assembly protein TadD
MIRAITSSGDHSGVAESFFKADTYEAERGTPWQSETWDDLTGEPEPLPPGMRKWKMITLSLLGSAVVALVGLWVYNEFIGVQEESLKGGAPAVASAAQGSSEPSSSDEATGSEGTSDEAAGSKSGNEGSAGSKAGAEQAAAGAEQGTQTDQAAGEQGSKDGAQSASSEGSKAEGEKAGEDESESESATESEAEASGGDYAALLEKAQNARGSKAIEAYKKALEANPNGAKALSELAFMLLNRGKNKEAAEYAEQAVVANPSDAKAWVTLGAARQTMGQRSKAMKAYRNCVDQGEGRYVRECRSMVR